MFQNRCSSFCSFSLRSQWRSVEKRRFRKSKLQILLPFTLFEINCNNFSSQSTKTFSKTHHFFYSDDDRDRDRNRDRIESNAKHMRSISLNKTWINQSLKQIGVGQHCHIQCAYFNTNTSNVSDSSQSKEASFDNPKSDTQKSNNNKKISTDIVKKSWLHYLNPIFIGTKIITILWKIIYVTFDSIIHPSKGMQPITFHHL